MRVKEEVVITRLRGLKEGDSMILPSWCKRRDVLQMWDQIDHGTSELEMMETDGRITVTVVKSPFSTGELRCMVLLALIAFWGVIGWLVAGFWG